MGRWLRRARRDAVPHDPSPEAAMELARAEKEAELVRMFEPRVNAASSALTRELLENDFRGRFYNAIRGES